LKLVLVVNGLDSGGAEKSTIKLCESLISDGHEVTLITISSKFDFFVLKNSILRINLDDQVKSRRQSPKRIGVNRLTHWVSSIEKCFELRKYLRTTNPDCVISMSAKVAVFTFFSTRFLGIAQIGSERIHPDSNIFSHGFMTDRLRPLIYRNGVILSVQTVGVVNWCKANWKSSSFLTPNHLTSFPADEEMESRLPVEMRKNEVLAISRDHPQKNLDFLLASWVFVEKVNPSAHLTLVGPENSSRVNALSEKLGIKNFSVQTRTEYLADFFNKSKLFVSTSRFEGFPNVVLEAISHGIPVITTPSCDVVEDFAKTGAVIVENGDDPQKFAGVIAKVLQDREQLSAMSQKALVLSKNYSWEQVGNTWYAAIAAAIDKK
jgi:GalNAc-alpha-(1->4)-GalNAc-alpha-(1->3)-diNAcBac-PP-undecaprenol alpha-1,4-N-acetyl-D-galactosaminyltransferase